MKMTQMSEKYDHLVQENAQLKQSTDLIMQENAQLKQSTDLIMSALQGLGIQLPTLSNPANQGAPSANATENER